ncbi:MAG: DUF1194 domain-containing protein [Pseudomonadota bacterium]
MRKAWLVGLLTALPLGAAAECRLALSMALDVSSSVDTGEYRLQSEGVARALENPEVRAALFQVPGAHVALQVFEWSGVQDQSIVLDWTPLRTAADVDRAVQTIRAHRRSFRNSATGLGRALRFAQAQIARAPDCAFRKIDISSDGQSNVGIPPQQLYAQTDFGDITVNGLAILSDETALDRYYRYFVIRGAGAFVEVAADFNAYPAAIRRKLIRELGVPQLGATPNGPSRLIAGGR